MSKKIIGILLCGLISLVSLAQDGFIYGTNGLRYKILKENPTGTPVRIGNTVQLQQVIKTGDSIVENTDISGTDFMKIDAEDLPLSITQVLRKLKKGDSVFVQLSCDSIYKKQFELVQEQGITKEEYENNMPTFLKKEGAFVDFWVKVLNVFDNDSLAEIESAKEDGKRKAYQDKMYKLQMEAQAKKDKPGFDKCNVAFKKYLGAKIKTLKKTPSGAYLQILKPGAGPVCKKGKTVEIRYKGMLLDGTVFDTNITAKGEEPKPLLPVVVLAGGTIKGFDEAIAMMRKGTKAKVYMPCNLAYGGQSPAPIIPAYSNMIFEIEIITIK